jgi:hypothetical protein
MKKVAFTAVDDRLYYAEGTHIMINSFRRFHPDIDLVVFRQDTVDKLFAEKNINWYQAKPFLAELLEDKYDLIVNLDADHIVLDRMIEIFDNVDYDIAFPWNFNDYENASFENITEEMYLQAGMWATTSREFLARWREANANAMQYLRKENDIVNLVCYNDPEIRKLKLKIVDKEKDYYGCKSLGREPKFEARGDKTYCKDEQVRLYHFARGNHFPKLDIPNMPLTDEVKDLWTRIATEGQTVKVTNV